MGGGEEGLQILRRCGFKGEQGDWDGYRKCLGLRHERRLWEENLATSPDDPHATQDRFELLDAAGMGFFGVVFYALTKHDFTVEQSRLTSDPANYDSAGGI
ncbi:hypothetical protein HBH56_136270 [Parastagonospora nodorum]|nr:hypothetical protein HBH56_136270 [Parastagonospora nodorum]KAH3949328.1 hypothetical protein HBH53_091430 [Parastagonospora nodorum]KAH3956497.1 hypothetical protein HBH51_240880 [Parastagonospora nodorum]KAH4011396.1 hypothetical protein HBI09_227020 [Parastagonospora nodorum]KAH4048579.1 hypothetical protein HBH49_160510 [Parastagonospora nodorum]